MNNKDAAPPHSVDRQKLAQALVQLRIRVDSHFAAAQEREGDAIQCRSGCDQCCRAGLSVFAIEAQTIRSALTELGQSSPQHRERIRTQGEGEKHHPDRAQACALLLDGVCSVYSARPLLCRAHGLPLREGSSEAVSTCALNFAHRAPAPQSVIQSQAIDLPLAAIANMWQAQAPTSGQAPAPDPAKTEAIAGQDGQRGARISLAELAAEPESSPR